MNNDKLTTVPDTDEELDDPYIHTISTDEFVETIERAGHEEDQPVTYNED